ncbi:Fc.00g029280.m01.CDS01 [Cosmosporella sp. VM-42]
MLSFLPRALRALLVIAVYHGLVTAYPANDDQQIPIQKQATAGAVASESDQCSRVGGAIISAGGNAVDAAVATTFCVGVVAPYHSGIGGGGFMMVRDKNGAYEAIDFRETAPGFAYQDMYKDKANESIYGGLSVAVPGEVKGLQYAHEKYGELPWSAVLAPAIDIAYKGFTVTVDMERYIRASINGHSRNFLAEDPSWAKDFVRKGKLLGQGERITRRRYARLAKKGAHDFYKGKLAEQMIRSIWSAGGNMTMNDLENYKVISRPILHTTYRGYNLYSIGAPASGAVTLNILKVMEAFKGGFKHRKQTIHKYVEAMKFAYGARLRLCDPDFDADMVKYQKQMLDPKNIDKIRKKIDPDHTQPIEAYDPQGIYPPEQHGTSQITTVDRDGMAVSLTTTVNLLWGSQVLDPRTGIIFNNEMNDFSIPGVPNEFGLKPSKENFIKPGKRPQSSITPVIVTYKDNTFFAAVGAAGGSRIISATTQALFHILNDGVDIRWAVNEPRLHDQVIPPLLLVEKRFNVSTVEYLRDRGHNITWVWEGLSAVHGVQLRKEWNGQFRAGNDERQKDSGGKTIP